MTFLQQHTSAVDVTEMVGKKMKYFCDQVIEAYNDSGSQTSSCLLKNVTSDTILPILCAISHLQICMMTLAKAALSCHAAVKNGILKFWTNQTGVAILRAAFIVQR